MEHLRILKDLQLKQYKPVYFLSGEEPYFIDEITHFMEEHILDEMSRAFGLTIVYGRDVQLDQLIGLAKGFPMMGELQLVIVKEAQDMKEFKSKKDNDEESDLKLLMNYIENPTPSTILVFNYKHKKLDKRKKLYKLLEKKAVMFESEKIKDNKLPDWIEKYINSKGFKIAPEASYLLAEYLGTDLGKVVNEVSKLAIILPPKSEITKTIIAENIGISKDYNVWELQKALGQKDVLKANRIIYYFEANPKSNPIQMVLPSLYGFFSKLAVYISLTDKRNAMQEMGVNAWALNDYKEAATKYSAPKVEKILSHLRTADKHSKGVDNTTLESGDILKELVFKILH